MVGLRGFWVGCGPCGCLVYTGIWGLTMIQWSPRRWLGWSLPPGVVPGLLPGWLPRCLVWFFAWLLIRPELRIGGCRFAGGRAGGVGRW